MDPNNIAIIKKTAEDILTHAGFSGTVDIVESPQDGEENVVCNITTGDDSNFLIGQYGVNLQAFQHIIRLAVRKQIPDRVKFALDVNSYRKEKSQTLVDQANEAAEQALREGRPIMMRAMTPYERRIVHLELSKNGKVVTESVGEGDERKVVVKPGSSV